MISELLATVLMSYPNARKNEAFSGNELGRIMRREIPAEIEKTVGTRNYVIKGSVGQGGWATVPWIAIMDRRITTTTQHGIYIVYLFSENGNALYLTLNQGCMDLIKMYGRPRTEQMLSQKAAELRNALSIPKELFDGTHIVTGNKYYDLGCIAYQEYVMAHFPDDTALCRD